MTEESRRERMDRLRRAAIEAEYETGRREESEEEAKDKIHVRLARMTLGIILLIAGAAMLAVPGPGLLTIGVALAILAQDFKWAERTLDRIKDRLPQGEDGELEPRVIVISVALFVFGIAATIWWNVIR